MMRHPPAIGLTVLLSLWTIAPTPAPLAQTPAPQPTCIARSNRNAQPLLQLQAKYEPEGAGQLGVTGMDEEISQFPVDRPVRLTADAQAVMAGLRRQLAAEKDPHVAQDLRIMIKTLVDTLKDDALRE